jgi:class 3 adenylate cyclase
MTSVRMQPGCPACGAETDADARFCPSCGRPLAASCPSCGEETKLGAQFCPACGERLDRPTRREEERKLVTVLFADLTGSTALGERLDPEQLRAVLSDYFSAMSSVVASWGGVVEKFIGDAVMSVFGIPAAHEDDAERALRAALEMQSRLAELNAEIAERHGLQLAMRIGVNSGEAIAGTGRDQVMVTGDVVNVAARLQQTAAPGDVVAGERSYLATRGAFVFEPLAEKALEGKSLPVRAWRVLADAEPARPRGVPGISTRMVGRDREIALLEALYQGSVEDSRPRLIALLGEAGIGKTRLCEEFLARVRSEAPAAGVYRGRCLSYGAGITYWALREILWSASGIALEDSGDVAAAKLEELVQRLFEPLGVGSAEVDRVLLALATTAGVVLAENPLDEMSPESIGEELGLAWPRFLSALAARHPTLVVIEDLHHAEPPLLDMIEHLVSRASGPACVIATARPELVAVRPGWSARPGMSQITLEALPDSQAEQLLEELLPNASAGLRGRVVAAAEGNPLFAEEIVAHLIDEGALSRTPKGIVEAAAAAPIAIPDTVRALLAARVDALPADEKRTLQHAAVVGRTFWMPTLESMGVENARPLLRPLEEKGFVVAQPASSLPGQAEYAFRHGLVRDVAYESIPKGRRARAHADVGRWIETLAGDRRDEYVELMAYHYEAAARPEDAGLAWPTDADRREGIRQTAVAVLVDAGRGAATRHEIDQALSFGDRALGLATTDAQRVVALELKAQAAHAGVRANEAWSYYLEALELVEPLGDVESTQRLRAHATLLWSRYMGALTGDEWKAQAREIVQRGLEEADEEDVSFEVGALLAGRSSFRLWNIVPLAKADARRDAERAVAIAQKIGSETLLSYALDCLSMELRQDGFCESAEFAQRALTVGRSMEDRGEAHELLVTAAIEFALAGQFDDAARVGADAAELAARLGPHRALHAASAQTSALLPPGRLAELQGATVTAADLVAEEGMHTCFHGLTALAGQAVAASEAGNADAATRALEVYDTTAVSDVGIYVYRTIEMLRPLVGAADSRRRLEKAETRESVEGTVYRLRLQLQLSAIEGDHERFRELAAEARLLARTACAPYLAWISDWGEAVELAETGRAPEACAKARAAAAALHDYGERYLAGRLLVDLLPRLDADHDDGLADEAIRRLETIGARRSAAEARRRVSCSRGATRRRRRTEG